MIKKIELIRNWTHHKDRLSCVCFALLVQCFVVVALEKVNLLSSR
uniref:Uncharacterized protein n=1 Tax=Brassica campestris TaxID=3711 RepID=A0A3P6CKE8_BRACM|nr:unnamed protein product [Brassica rapa]